jgi:hypothetical protein
MVAIAAAAFGLLRRAGTVVAWIALAAAGLVAVGVYGLRRRDLAL